MRLKDFLGMALEVATNAVVLAFLALAGAGYLLYRGIEARHASAYIVLGGLLVLLVSGLGAGFVLFVQWVGERREASRERREQERFRDNAKENLALMQQLAAAQAAQARMLSAHQAALTRALPASGQAGDVVDGDFVAFDPALLAGIDEELGNE